MTFVFWMLIGGATSYFASQRGRDPFIWFMIGSLLGILGLVVLFLLPSVKESEESGGSSPDNDSLVDTSHEIVSSDFTHDYLVKDWFYLDAAGQQQGPVRFDVLREKWNSGTLLPESYLWCEGMDNWKKVADLPDLRAALATTLL